MTVLVTLSHGSRHPQAARRIHRLTTLAGRLAGVPSRDAYLEFNKPDLVTIARELARSGHDHMTVVPLLFTHAYHARHDVPREIDKARKLIYVTLTPGLGTGFGIETVLRRRLAHADTANKRVILYHVGSSVPGADKPVAQLARRVGATPLPSRDRERLRHGNPMHLLPLFVTDGLLLDAARRLLPEGSSIDDPLGTELAVPVGMRVLESRKVADPSRAMRKVGVR